MSYFAFPEPSTALGLEEVSFSTSSTSVLLYSVHERHDSFIRCTVCASVFCSVSLSTSVVSSASLHLSHVAGTALRRRIRSNDLMRSQQSCCDDHSESYTATMLSFLPNHFCPFLISTTPSRNKRAQSSTPKRRNRFLGDCL